LLLLQSLLKPLFLHLLSPFTQIAEHDSLHVFPECDLVDELEVFEFLSLQVQVDHDLPLLEELLAESKDPESLFQPLSVFVLGVPVIKETVFYET
jgi:hypothetical protein